MGDSRSIEPDGHRGGAVSGALLRLFAVGIVATVLVFLVNDYLTYWRGWPGVAALLAHFGWLGAPAAAQVAGDPVVFLGWVQLLGYLSALAGVAIYVGVTSGRSLRADARVLGALAAYIVRGAFWAVLLVGVADMLISFLRVEGFLEHWVGPGLTGDLGRSVFRGTYIHLPLIALALLIALFTRTLGFIWLSLLVVLAEFQIVISRFVFSYEQVFMGDLVRFWYAALFLFASAYALVSEGHVRVDVFYARFSIRRKAWVNLLGSSLLGMPLCWTILLTGMRGKGSSLNSPLLSFEISQSGFGMYGKYLMAGFLVVYAVSMLAQFSGYVLSSAADLREEPGAREPASPGTV